ncbi:MAG: MFS transporter, partial [Methanosarcinales archaeon]
MEAVHIESAPAPVSAGKDAGSGTSAEPPSPPSVGVAPEAVSAASMVTVVPAADAAGANVAPACEPDTSSQVVEPAQDNGTDAGQACVPAADDVTGLEVVNITKLSVDTRSGNMMQALHAGPLTTASTLAGSTVLESGTPDASTLGVGMVATTQELRSQESTLAPRVSQARAMNAHEERSRILRRRTVVRQIMSREWALFCIYFVIQLYRFNTYVGTVDTQLTSMGQSGGKYTVIFGIVSPLGFFAQFLAGPVIDKFQLDVAVYIQCIVGLALSITNLIHSLNVQIVTFVLWIVFRAFHFSIMSTFLSRTFGFHTLGITVGSVQLVGGLVCLTQTLFLKWAFASPGATSERGNFTNPNIFMLVIEGCALFFPVYLTYRMR